MALVDRDCIFCQIIAGCAPASIVYRDDRVIAFMDLLPINPGHVVVVPVGHAAYLAELDLDCGGRMFQVAQKIAAALRGSGIRCEGVNLFLADGAAAMQEVFHAHLHVIPRFAGDGFGLKGAEGIRQGREELDEAARQIRAGVGEA